MLFEDMYANTALDPYQTRYRSTKSNSTLLLSAFILALPHEKLPAITEEEGRQEKTQTGGRDKG
jgi:hypothetical protein